MLSLSLRGPAPENDRLSSPLPPDLYEIPAIMSGRILSHRLVPLLRTGLLARHVHNAGTRTGGLLRADGSAALRGRAWPVGANSIHNNVPAVRAISFSRMLPRLAVKLARVPAMFGGAMVASFAYFQYQATRMFSYYLIESEGGL